MEVGQERQVNVGQCAWNPNKKMQATAIVALSCEAKEEVLFVFVCLVAEYPKRRSSRKLNRACTKEQVIRFFWCRPQLAAVSQTFYTTNHLRKYSSLCAWH